MILENCIQVVILVQFVNKFYQLFFIVLFKFLVICLVFFFLYKFFLGVIGLGSYVYSVMLEDGMIFFFFNLDVEQFLYGFNFKGCECMIFLKE